MRRRLWIKGLLAAGLLLLGLPLGYLLWDGLRPDGCQADLAVIMGNTVHPDGSLSPRLKSRLDKGLALYRQKRVKRLLVSGGLGKEGHWEGTKMQEYLLEQGVPPADVLPDNTGSTTWNTVQTVARLRKQQPGLEKIMVVSQFFHLSRCKLLFRKAGIRGVCSEASDYVEGRDVYASLREIPALYYYYFSN
jgi:vancomycin permeability regulator SanA